MPTDESNIVSMAGQPIYRHGEPSEWKPPQGEECIEEISNHIEAHVGKVETVFHEILSDTVHIDVHWVKPNEKFPFVRFVTSGMSDLAMNTPEGHDIPKYMELMISLPADWKIDEESFKDESWYWPVRLLKMLARLPHKHNTWLGFGHTVPNGDPAEPYSQNTALCGAIVLQSVSAPNGFHKLSINAEKEVTFMSVLPLYVEEMNLKLRKGTNELLALFDKKNINDIVSIKRVDVTKKRFGFL